MFSDQITKKVYNNLDCTGTAQTSTFAAGCVIDNDPQLGQLAVNFKCSSETMTPILPAGLQMANFE